MADNLNQTIQEFQETLTGGVTGWTNTIEELTRATLRTGKEYGDGFKGLTDQFRGLDVALSDVKDMLGQSIRTGVSFEGTNKKLLVDLKRLGFNMGKFMDVMGTFEQVLGFSESTTGHLADSIVDFSVKFGRSAEQLASTMQNLIEPMARMSNAYGSGAAAGFAESIIGLGAAMGPKMADQLGPVISKFISADPEGFKRAALAGQGGGAMDSPQAMINMAKGMMTRIDKLVTPGAPFTAGIAAQMFGLSQGDINILRQLANTNMSQLAVAEENMRYEQAKALATQTFTGSLNTILLDLQMGMLPVMDAVNDSISIVFKVFKETFPSFSDSAIEFGEFVGGKLRNLFSEENVNEGFSKIIGWGKEGVAMWKGFQVTLDGWVFKTQEGFTTLWTTLHQSFTELQAFIITNWDAGEAKMNSWYEESLAAFASMKDFFTNTAVSLATLMTDVFNEIGLRLSASQIASSQNGGMFGGDGFLAAMAGGGDFRKAAEEHKDSGSNLSPANFFSDPIARDTATSQQGAAMFADPALLEAQQLLVEAMENQTEATNTQVVALKQFNKRQSLSIISNASDFTNERKPSTGNPGRLAY